MIFIILDYLEYFSHAQFSVNISNLLAAEKNTKSTHKNYVYLLFEFYIFLLTKSNFIVLELSFVNILVDNIYIFYFWILWFLARAYFKSYPHNTKNILKYMVLHNGALKIFLILHNIVSQKNILEIFLLYKK